MPPPTLRPATESDIPSLNAIHAHYVLNTVVTFVLEPHTNEEFSLLKFQVVRSAGLPFIVALPSSESEAEPIGFVYVLGFRGSKGGYHHTLELTVYCHPSFTNVGVGTALLTRLLDVLRRPEVWGEEWIGKRWWGEEGRPRQLIACMAVDKTGPKEGCGVKDWYERFGFVQRGHLSRVGWKLGRWIDTVYLQLSL